MMALSPSPPLPLGYIVVWKHAKKQLYGQSALSGSSLHNHMHGALPHLHVLLLGARIAHTVDL